MKFMRYLVTLMAAVCCLGFGAQGQTTLAAGDLVFVGYNSAGAEDEFSFVLLTSVSAGTQIRFTDFGWRSDAAAFQTANPCGANTGAVTDGAITWTSSTALACGTQVSIQCQSALTASTGTVTGLQATASNSSIYMNLATGGESIFAFQGTLASPTLISALNMNGGWDAVLSNCTFTSQTSTLPAALASHNLVKSPETDNARYDCSTVANSPANLRAAIYNNTNWTGTDGAANIYTLPLGCTFSCNSCTAPAVTAHPPNRTVCAGGNTTFNITATGTGLTYQWQENSGSGFGNITASSMYQNVTTNTLTINGVTAGMSGNLYRCVVTGTCGTATSNNGTLTVSTVSGSTTITNVACNGGTTGAINLTPSGGTAPYTFNWGGGVTTEDRTGLAAGNYSVTITDANTCTGIVNATVTQPTAVSGSTTITNVACNGGTAGAINLTPSGGTGPYTFNWGGGITTEDRTGLGAGSYSVTITDANSCTGTVNATITQPTAVSGSTTITNVACFGGTTGAINLTPAGGTGPYTFNWGGGVTTEDRTGLSAGSYSVTITDANSCTGTVNATVTQPSAAVSGSTTITNVACNGGTTGAINLTPSGGTGPYTFNWGGGVTTEDRTGLAAGSYSVIITDANSCTGTVNVTVTQPTAVSGSTTVTNVACFGGANGTIDLTPSGGTPGYTYNWGGGVTTQDRTGLTSGSYSVTITDGNGCTGVVNATVTQPSAVSGSTTITNVACFGGTTGAINLTPSGGTGPYTFNWGGGVTTEDRTGLASGNYSVTITDANSCTGTVNATVTQPAAAVSGSTTITNITCNGGTTGAINLTPSGGTGPYTFNWGGGVTTEDRTGLGAGNYSVTITDANSCTGTVNATITQPTAVSGSTTITNVACNGGTTGAINLTPTGGTGPYTFNWGGGITTEDRTGLSAGSYSVTITDANSCTGIVNVNLTEPPTLDLSTGGWSHTPCGQATGWAAIYPGGGTAPYTYSWSPGGAITNTITNLGAGSYTVTVTDANGCTGTRTFLIEETSSLSTAAGSQTNVACNGASTGAASVTPSGGTAPYTYSWSPGGATTSSISGVPAGSYTVTVTDANGCSRTRTYTITQPSAINTAAGSQTNVACNGASTGAASITPSGGTPGYTYSWSPGGATTSSISNLAAGTYTVTVTDLNNCTATRNYTITEPSVISTATGSQSDATCNGGADGAASVSPSGGTPPYTYSWSPSGGTGSSATGLVAGTYTVTVTDANNCTATRNYTIGQPSVISTVSGSQTNVLCNGGSTGTATVSPSGGTAPYTYSWSPSGGTAATATGLAVGTYTVTVTDANGCTATRNYTITQPTVINTVAGSQTNLLCNGGATGSASVSPSGGTAPYTYSWSPSGGTAATATNLSAGTYTVTVTDANGCIATRNFTLTQPTAINTTVGSQVNATCAAANGSATITPSGGTPPYTYSWTSGGTASTENGLAAGVYTVTVTDANNCTATRNYTITDPGAINMTMGSQTNVSCNGGNNGSATITPSAGTPPYTYSWAPSGGTAATATGLSAGTYTVTVTDFNGCTANRSFTLTEPTAISTATGSQTNVLCNGASTGSATITPSGGTGSYTYLWSPGGATTATATGLAAGTYLVEVEDANGCEASRLFTITQPPAISTVAGSQTNVACNGGTTGAASVTPSGGVAPYTYSWSPSGGTASSASGLAAGTYTVTVTDANNCTATRNYTITQPTVISTATGSQSNVTCNGGANGSASVTPSGGTPPYTYSWSPSGGTAATATGLTAGTYTVTVTDNNNCTATRNYTITEPAFTFTLYNVTGGGNACVGAGGVAVGLSGSQSGIEYQLRRGVTNVGSPIVGTGSALNFGNQTTSGVYTVRATNTVSGCQGNMNGSATVTIYAIPTAFNVTGGGDYCAGGSGAVVALSGSQSGVNYQLYNNGTPTGTAVAGTGSSISFGAQTAAGTYTVVATDATTTCTTTMTGSVPVTIKPVPDVNAVSDQALCNGATTVAVNFSGSLPGTTFAWDNNTTSIGLGTNGPGNIAAFTAINTGTSPVVATVTVIPQLNGCNGAPATFTYTVNPTPTVNAVVNQAICNGATTTAVSFGGAVTGTTYNWTNSNTAIGLGANGTGDISGFTATNTSNAPITGTITVTPTANGCPGASTTFTYTVNPTPTVNTVGNQTLCNGATTAAVSFSGAVTGTTYSWTNSAATIGLGANGTGNIAAFTAVNSGTAPVVATVTVTPSANSCTGTATTFTYTVNPTPTVNAVASQTRCNGATTAVVNFTGEVTGTTYSWTNSNTAIGLGANGTGNISGFTATNTTNAPITGTITVTPSANGCTGTATTFTYTVNPTPTINAISNQTMCNGVATAAVNFSGPVTGTSYAWTNSNTAIGLAASGSGNIPSFTATNSTSAPITGTIIVTPTANSCPGLIQSYTYTVNPTPVVDAVSDQALCNGATTTAVNFSGAVTGTSYSWSNSNTSIGLGANGTGNIPAFTATNGGATTITGTITVTPFANGCIGAAGNFDIEVFPTPVTNTVSDLTVCNGAATTAVNFTSATPGTTYTWTNNTTSIGLAASGNGNIASFNAVNNGGTTITATVTVTPTANGCTGPVEVFDIIVNPGPIVNAIANQAVCNGATTSASFSSNVPTAVYTWTNNNTAIGLGANGTGDIAAFTAINTGNAPVTATITVIATNAGCVSAPVTFDIVVNPTPSVSTTANQTLCNGASTTAVVFGGSSVTGTTYSWTNNTTSIGLGASGNGDISSFTATNSTSAPVTATITVTPSANGCAGPSQTFDITVNPTPDVANITNQVLCNMASTSAVNFSGAVTGTTYTWTNNTTSIGLGANGTGNIGSFTATNSTSAPVTATITVTPAANGCTGPSKTFDITVNPTPGVDNIANQTLCNGAPTTTVTFSGAVTGTTYAWTNNTTSIGLAASGNGNIASFTATNSTSAPVTATITVTPSANGCTGPSKAFDITVNPTPGVNNIANQTLCNNASTTTVTFTGAVAGTTYAWTNNTPSIGLVASGNGNIASFTATNSTNAPVTATITVTPSANGCTGPSKTFNITVNPTPSVNAVANQTLCNNAATTTVNFGGTVTGSTYAWTNNTTSIGLAASGNGNIASFTATNSTNAPVTATITVTPSANGCAGPVKTFNITVNPTPSVNTVANQAVCNAASTTAVTFGGTVTGTTYAWTNNTTSIGLAASGNGNIASFTATNNTNAPVTATITVTPSANGCSGPSKTFNITVNPTPDVDAIPNQVLCNGANTATIVFNGAVNNTAFDWTNTAPSIGLSSNGVGNIATFVATNTTNIPVIATIVVTPIANGCTGSTKNFTIRVNPTPTVNNITDKIACNGALVPATSPTSPVSGATYAWTNTDASIGLAASGTGNIPAFNASNTTADPVVAVVTVTPTANGCVGIPRNYEITVNPTPMLSSSLTPPAVCDNSLVSYTPTSATTGTTFAWSRAAVTGISNATASGTNNPNETLINTTPNPVTVTYVYTLVANACANTQNVTVTVNPTPRLTSPLTDSVCSEALFAYTPSSATAGTTYAWSRASVAGITPATGGGTGNISETLVNTTNAGINVNYVYTLSANGCTNAQTITVRVSSMAPTPVISIMPPTTVCDNTMYQNFGADGPATNGAYYTWTADNATIWASGSNNENAIVNFTDPGTAVITLSANYPNSGCTNSSSYTVEVGTDVSEEPQIIYYNGRFVCLLNQAQSYRWGYDDKLTLDSNIILGETNQDYLNTTPDLVNRYYWVMTTKAGCMQKSYYNKPTTVSTVVSKDAIVKLYPNPATDKVNIEVSELSTIHASIKLFDVTGKDLKSAPVTGVKTQLDIAELTPGIYFIGYYENGTRLATLRFIKN